MMNNFNTNEWMQHMQGMFANLQNHVQQSSPTSPLAPSNSTQLLNTQALEKIHAQFLVDLEALQSAATLPDKRFAANEWLQPFYKNMAAAYLAQSRALHALCETLEVPAKQKAQIKFAAMQMIDAASPANNLITNPHAQQAMLDSKGETFTRGIHNLLGDLQKGRMSQTDESQFEVGRNLATTPGAVVFENEMFQLIQYTPVTAQVHARPLLMVPPCINKFYILDLQAENSFVAHALAQGITVFMLSWRNPQEAQGHWTWDDYIRQGVLTAIEQTCAISAPLPAKSKGEKEGKKGGEQTINALGFCVGGTLLTTALAILAARKQAPVHCFTLLTTLLDFADTGILDVFVDERQVKQREDSIGKGGLMPARDLASAFSSLRPNDLIWNYVVNNYLKGETPPAFDLLYWNGDSTNLPGPMFTRYLRDTYLENKLKNPNQLIVDGTPVDLSAISAPAYLYCSREDHIVPPHAAYASVRILKNEKRFVMGASGHIAGVINAPAKGKRSYWSHAEKTTTTAKNRARAASSHPNDIEAWLNSAQEHKGSWWPDWYAWLKPQSGALVKAPTQLGDAQHKPIEAAPGRYVKVRVV